ncbi:MAG: hypothetical protein ACFHW5_17915 [Verrucomicrobiota bacterium]
MPNPIKHKAVQARILDSAEAVRWMFESLDEAEQRHGFDPEVPPADHRKKIRMD